MTTTSSFAQLTTLLLALSATAGAQTPTDANRAAGRDTARSDPSRSVTLSLTEYNRLIDLAGRPSPAGPVVPMPALLARAELRIRVDRDTAHGVYSLAGDVLRPGIARVNLVSGATILDGSIDGRPLPLVADNGTHAALLPGPGPFALTLDWGAPLTFAPGRASFVLPVPTAGTAHATIDLPGEQADVHLSAGIVTRRTVANGRTIVDATLRPGTQADVWWSLRDSAPVAAARDVRMFADVFSLVTIGDADFRVAALVDLAVVQGEPRTIDVRLPPGYDLAGVTGSDIESSERRDGGVAVTVADPTLRRHQFLVSLERSHAGGSFVAETEFVSLPAAQRERGEVAIEGAGTLELNAAERNGMHRIDVRELNGALQSLARLPILSAFRYQRGAAVQVALALEVQRFRDAEVLVAVADRAIATTLITSEGRTLTEVALQIRNRAQPFLKVALPTGATIVSVDVAGEAAKPVVGSDGTRVPLLRPGYRPAGPYTVSYVYLHAGEPFARKGDLQMALPRMDIPVGLIEWEMFVPDRYRVQLVDGNVIPKPLLAAATRQASGAGSGAASGSGAGIGPGSGGGVSGIAGGVMNGRSIQISIAAGALPGQIRGTVRDSAGRTLPGTTIVLDSGSSRRAAISAGDGTFLISGVPSGTIAASARLNGFKTESFSFAFDQQPRQLEFVLHPASLAESVTVSSAAPAAAPAPPPQTTADTRNAEPSQNVIKLQRRAAGVLPIRVDVPHAGTSYQFVKPVVVDQDARVTLRYKRR